MLMLALLRERHAVQLADEVRLQNLVADMREEPWRQHAVVEAAWLCAWSWPQIGAGP